MFDKSKPELLIILLLALTGTLPAETLDPPQLKPEVIDNRLRQYAGSNPVRAATLLRLFREAGCARLEQLKVPGSAAPNVSCTLPGKGRDVIVVGAHFDRVAAGDGVVDNWSGASLLPSLFESLSTASLNHSFVFVSFTDEEKGFVGSKSYVNSLSPAELARIRCMIDMDTLGLGPTEIWVSNSDPKLVKELTHLAASKNLPVRGMNVDGVGDSDGRSFKKRNIPIITLHSVTNETLDTLHSEKDSLSAIKFSDYYQSYQLILSYLLLLDKTWTPT